MAVGEFDSNGDGQPDTAASLQSQYAAFQPYYFEQLRLQLGPKAVILANSGAPVEPHHALNGVAIESEWCDASRVELPGVGWKGCEEALTGQRLVAHSPTLSVLWLSESQSKSAKIPHGMPANEQFAAAALMQRRVAGVHTGYDVSDGSWGGGFCN